jgi:hypothetical protein
MDGLRNCICTATLQPGAHVAGATNLEAEFVVSFSVSYSKLEQTLFCALPQLKRFDFGRLEFVFHRPRGTGFPEAN